MIGKILSFPFILVGKVLGLIFGSLRFVFVFILGIIRFLISHVAGTIMGAVIGFFLGRKHVGVKLSSKKKN